MIISGLDGLGDSLRDHIQEVKHEELAQALADHVRELGRTNLEGVDVDFETDGSALDEERIKARALEILRGE